LAISGWIEDVAHSGSFAGKSLSRWLELLIVCRVGQSNEEVTSVVSVDIVGNPFLILTVVPDLVSLSGSVNLLSHLINIRVGVHVLPERFSIVWIVTTSVVLFRTIVIEWDTSSSQSESKSRFETMVVVELILESSIVVVINEKTKSVNIFEFTVFFSKSIFKVVHTLA